MSTALTILTPVGAFLAGLISSYVIYLKTKEESDNFKLDQAIDTWQELSVSHKNSWDLCEGKYRELTDKYEEQQSVIMELRNRLLQLEYQVRGLEPL